MHTITVLKIKNLESKNKTSLPYHEGRLFFIEKEGIPLQGAPMSSFRIPSNNSILILLIKHQ